ncbi:MAG: heavy-metal-associated domain-containing protein [Spirochaetes bacterium]|nr:heavy-metal-associated domain-containing protein [Spirochaetota bacterium]
MKRWLIFVLILSAVFLTGYFVITARVKEPASKKSASEEPAASVKESASEKPASDISGKPDIVVSIDGMTCGLCTAAVAKSLYKVDGIKKVSVSLEDGKAYITGSKTIKDSDIKKAVERAGAYRVTAIKRSGGSS